MSDTFLYAQLQPTTLAGSGSSIGDTTLTLSAFKTIDGVALAMTDFGSIGFFTLEPNNGTQEEQGCFTGITQNGNGTATLTGVKNVSFLAPYTQTSGLAKSHTGGSKFVISNTSGFYDKMTSKADDETIAGTWTFTSPNYPKMDSTAVPPTTAGQLATKKYVDDTATFGAPNMATSTAGIAQEATDTQINAGTQAGSTGADLAVNPKYLKDSIYYTQLPTADQKAALAGSGTPSGANKFVTADTDALKQTIANLDATVTLGSSDSKYPSQNAVKTYVDNSSPIVKTGIATRAENASAGTQNIAHGLGKTPKKVSLTVIDSRQLAGYSGKYFANSKGIYDGTNTACLYTTIGQIGGSFVYDQSLSSTTYIIYLAYSAAGASAYQRATITVDSTNIALAWTMTDNSFGFDTSNINILWEAQ